MHVHRLFYVLILAVSGLFFVLYPHWIAWYLVVTELLLLPFDLLISLPGMLTRRVSLSAPYMLEQGAQGALTVANISESRFPSGAVRLRLCVSHEDKTVFRKFLRAGARGSRGALAIDTSRSGLTAFSIRRISSISLLGLFAVPLRVSDCVPVSTLIIPAPVKPVRAVSLPKAVRLKPKPGGGFSEDHDIRPYRPGDPVRGVHWKLSAKHDKLLFREPLIPPPHSRLVSVSAWSGAAERDLILGRLRWVSEWLTRRGVPYYVKLEGRGNVAEITKPEELTAFLRLALGGADAPVPPSLPSRFTWVFRVDAKGVAG